MFNLEEKLSLLKAYFAKQPEIVMAFIFGSVVKGQETQESDVDIAVYFKPSGPELEWEDEKEYPEEDRIWDEVEKIIGRRTDLVVLNRAPATLVYSVFHQGKPIVIKDKTLYQRLFLLISSAAEDFRDFAADFWRIKERSASLNEIDRHRLVKLVDFSEKELGEFDKFFNLDKHEYENNPDRRRNFERWAENIVNSSIDLAKIILSSEKKPIPQTYREILQSLSLIPNFDPVVAEKLSQFAKLRNILAHEYLDIRFARLQKFVQEMKAVYSSLLSFTRIFINKK